MIVLRDVTVNYREATPLKNLSIELDSTPTVVMGPSGSGKSTLLRVIAGLQAPDSGTVQINGTPVKMPTWSSAGDTRVALIHQDYRLVQFLTVAENLRLAAEMRGKTVTAEAAERSLERVGLGNVSVDRLPGTLSGGEQQRVAIARALLCGAEVLVADEPTGALDADNTVRVTDILAKIGVEDSVEVIIATHDPLVAERIPSKLVLTSGRLREAA
jgi:putative ABC transport system ATP-binding protein